MTDKDPLQALDQRIDEWLRYVYDPSATLLEPDDPPHPRWVALHNDLRALEQRCTDEGSPAALRDRLRELRNRLRGRLLIEDRNPQGRILACRRCGGSMAMTEISVVNHKDPDCMLVDVFPDAGPNNLYAGAAVGVILGMHDGVSDYAVDPGDEDTQGVMFELWCSNCRRGYRFDVLFTAAGTKFYWSDWKETAQEGTA